MRPFIPVLMLALGAASAGASATITTTATCGSVAGGFLSDSTTCSDFVEFGEQSVRSLANVSAAYGRVGGFAGVRALWGTAAAGGASFVAEYTDTVVVTLTGDTPVWAVFEAPLISGAGATGFGMLNEFDLGIKRATISTTSSINVSSVSGSFGYLSSVTQTTSRDPEGYEESGFTSGAPVGSIQLYTGLELTINVRFGASADAFGSANASIGAGGDFDGLGLLRARGAFGTMEASAPVAGSFWRGIRFETADGTPVSPDLVLLQSASGTDWTLAAQPVPEPGTWALWALGLAAAGLRMRRMRMRAESD
jgi:hypothetical protein